MSGDKMLNLSTPTYYFTPKNLSFMYHMLNLLHTNKNEWFYSLAMCTKMLKQVTQYVYKGVQQLHNVHILPDEHSWTEINYFR
jgi:hypothetical protein